MGIIQLIVCGKGTINSLCGISTIGSQYGKSKIYSFLLWGKEQLIVCGGKYNWWHVGIIQLIVCGKGTIDSQCGKSQLIVVVGKIQLMMCGKGTIDSMWERHNS